MWVGKEVARKFFGDIKNRFSEKILLIRTDREFKLSFTFDASSLIIGGALQQYFKDKTEDISNFWHTGCLLCIHISYKFC